MHAKTQLRWADIRLHLEAEPPQQGQGSPQKQCYERYPKAPAHGEPVSTSRAESGK